PHPHDLHSFPTRRSSDLFMSTRAEISGGAIFLPCTSTQASPLSARVILKGTMVMSRRTTSSSNLRPMRRLMANRVLWGLVTAWRSEEHTSELQSRRELVC